MILVINDGDGYRYTRFLVSRKTLINDNFLRTLKVTMKFILRKDLCALRKYSRVPNCREEGLNS